MSSLNALAATMTAAVLGTWAVTVFVLALQATSCRIAGAAGGVAADYRIPGGCFLRDGQGRWAPAPMTPRP